MMIIHGDYYIDKILEENSKLNRFYLTTKYKNSKT